MDRIIQTNSFKEFSKLHLECSFNAFKELASEILELNNRVLNPILRNNILCRTEVELALLKQIATLKKNNPPYVALLIVELMKLIDAQVKLSKFEMKYHKRLQKATKKGISDLVWTGTTTEFVELSKALFLSKCFNKGGVTYKEMFAQLCSTFNIQIPENPLFSIIHTQYDTDENSCESTSLDEPISITNQFYTIGLKNIISGELLYGRTKYDCDNGTMYFTAPNQTLVYKDLVISSESYHITVHKDFIRSHRIYEKIRKYHFFNYQVNEALHLSPKEEQIIKDIFKNIQAEYHNNQDQFSKEIILSHLETLLQYADRFYNRQFLNRKEISHLMLDKFNAELRKFYNENTFYGIPNIDTIAEKLSVSQRYLSDTLKKETSKSAKEHINLFIVEQAKDKLLGTTESISEIVYQLGFEYPQHFSKMFKKQTGKSPKKYRIDLN